MLNSRRCFAQTGGLAFLGIDLTLVPSIIEALVKIDIIGLIGRLLLLPSAEMSIRTSSASGQ